MINPSVRIPQLLVQEQLGELMRAALHHFLVATSSRAHVSTISSEGVTSETTGKYSLKMNVWQGSTPTQELAALDSEA